MEQDIESIVDALRSRRINTLTELRRMERILVAAIQPHISDLRHSSLMGVLVSAWLNYVQGNNLLSELRNLARDYPFSSGLLDEARSLVDADPERDRSWNYAWLVLKKIVQDNLIDKHARALATDPEMWGGSLPGVEMLSLLENNCRESWAGAVRIMLRHWDTDPVYPVRY